MVLTQPQSALAFQLAQQRTLMIDILSCRRVMEIIITHSKNIYLKLLNNSSKSRLTLCFEKPMHIHHLSHHLHHCNVTAVTGNALIQRTRSLSQLARREL